MRKTIILIQIIFLFGCSNKYLRTPPVPTTQLSVDSEMQYIENTDQADRKALTLRIILFRHKKTIDRLMSRDSIRVARVEELIKSDTLQSDSAKFSAGIILFHSDYSKRALQLFNEINAETKNKGMKLNSQTWINICVKDTLR